MVRLILTPGSIIRCLVLQPFLVPNYCHSLLRFYISQWFYVCGFLAAKSKLPARKGKAQRCPQTRKSDNREIKIKVALHKYYLLISGFCRDVHSISNLLGYYAV